MTKVEPTGVILEDICSIQTDKCVAKKKAPITAVWTFPERIQINVCRPCLEEQVRSGEWEVAGARVERRADVAVYSPDKKLQLVVEVKKKPGRKVTKSWATMVHRNLLMHSGIPTAPYFLLAVPPDYIFLWKESRPTEPGRRPDYEVEAKKILDAYAHQLSSSPETTSEHYYLEYLVARWLKDLVKSKPSTNDPTYKWLYDSGLYEAISGGSVVMQSPLAA